MTIYYYKLVYNFGKEFIPQLNEERIEKARKNNRKENEIFPRI
jgi:hypothetical protein